MRTLLLSAQFQTSVYFILPGAALNTNFLGITLQWHMKLRTAGFQSTAVGHEGKREAETFCLLDTN